MEHLPLTRVDIEIALNCWWDDQFQFGDPTDFTWNFTGFSFYLGIKQHNSDAADLVTYTSTGGTITVQDPVNRILGMLVPDETLKLVLSEGRYVYDLLMVNNSTGQTDGLMYGELTARDGGTQGPN